MIYSDFSHIKSIEDVNLFFHHLIYDRKINFHPDDDFSDYINNEDSSPAFSSEEVRTYNQLMDESFDVCEKSNIDIYGIGLQMLKDYLTE